MIITEKQRKFLSDKIENFDEIIKSENTNDLLLPMNDLIFMIGMDKNYNLNEVGRELQKIYDEIYDQNPD